MENKNKNTHAYTYKKTNKLEYHCMQFSSMHDVSFNYPKGFEVQRKRGNKEKKPESVKH